MRETQAKYSNWSRRHVTQISALTVMLGSGAAASAWFGWPDSSVFGWGSLGLAALAGCWFVFRWPDTYRPERVEDPLMMMVVAFLVVWVWVVVLIDFAGWFPAAVASTAGAANGVATLWFVFKFRHVPMNEPVLTASEQLLHRVVAEVFPADFQTRYWSQGRWHNVLIGRDSSPRMAQLATGPVSNELCLDRWGLISRFNAGYRNPDEQAESLRDLALVAKAYLCGEGRLKRRGLFGRPIYIVTVGDRTWVLGRTSNRVQGSSAHR